MTEQKPTAARIRVWPKEGLDVLDEYSGEPIKPGADVPYTRLTIRRINDGDLLTQEPALTNAKPEHFDKDRG